MAEGQTQIPEANRDIPAATDTASLSGFEWWRRTLQYKTGMGLTPEAKTSYERDLSLKKDTASVESKEYRKEKQCKNCNEWKEFMLDYSPSVVFMTEQIYKINKDLVVRDKVFCGECTEPKYAGYHPDFGIQICQNYLTDKWQLEEALTHELIHLYDDNRFKVDWFDLKHYACSEIRAASLSGECKMLNEFFKVNGSRRVAKGHQECVKRLAFLGVKNHPNCKDDDHARSVVDEVFRSCFNDTRPFEMIYK